MGMTQRVLLAAGILIVDLALFFIPLSALLLAWVIIFNPPWVREFINKLDGTE
jgi:hypothetical protein